jgi:hypothetical protein
MFVINVLQYDDRSEEISDVVSSHVCNDDRLDEAIAALKKVQEEISEEEGFILNWEESPGASHGVQYHHTDTPDDAVHVVGIIWTHPEQIFS